MAYGNWDALLKEYQEIYLPSRYGQHAQSMIDLIPELRQRPAFAEVIPFSSHATLCLKLPSNRTLICLWGEDDGNYRIYLDHHEAGISDEKVVAPSEVLRTLQDYLRKIPVPEI
jgi:hypothetical protein